VDGIVNYFDIFEIWHRA